MIVELPKGMTQEFLKSLSGQIESSEVAEQEQFFGEAETVAVFLELAPAALNLVASTIAAFAASRTIRIIVNGTQVSSAGEIVKAAANGPAE